MICVPPPLSDWAQPIQTERPYRKVPSKPTQHHSLRFPSPHNLSPLQVDWVAGKYRMRCSRNGRFPGCKLLLCARLATMFANQVVGELTHGILDSGGEPPPTRTCSCAFSNSRYSFGIRKLKTPMPLPPSSTSQARLGSTSSVSPLSRGLISCGRMA